MPEARGAAAPAAPRPPDDALGPARELERSMRPLVDAALGAAEELEERVAPMHLRALEALDASGPAHVSALADAMSLLPSTVSRLSDRLTAAGLITREVSPVNRRATLLELTAAGRQVLADLVRARSARLDAILRAMTDADRASLLSGMRAMAHAAGSRPEGGGEEGVDGASAVRDDEPA